MSQQSCGKQASASDVTSSEEKVGNIVLCMAAIEQDTLRRLSPGSGRNPCSVHLIHMKLWDPTQLLHFLSLNKQLKWALFYVTGWNTSQMYLTSPTFKVDLVIQSANFPKLSELSLGRHVTPRPCGVLLRRLICNLGERAFFFSQAEQRKRFLMRLFSTYTYLLQMRRTFQLHESIMIFFVLERIWLDPLRV